MSKKFKSKSNKLNSDQSSDKKHRLAIVDLEKCKPHKCNKECKKFCPVERQGVECVTIGDIEDVKLSNKKKVHAKISEITCIGCGICVKKCPFEAIKIINVPVGIGNFIVHRYGKNGFRLYKMPVMKPHQILGLLGQNGIGKTTVMQILAGKIKPNFENFKQKFSNEEIIGQFKGNELHKYMEKLYNDKLRVVIKPQHVDQLVRYLTVKGQDPSVQEYLLQHSEYKEEELIFRNVIQGLGLDSIIKYKIKTLSGGELQRLMCASIMLKKADVYIFDEPTNFLDVKQRLKIAGLIKSLSSADNYIIVIEHDLAILDYLSDYICLMYGKPSAYGVVSIPSSTANAINMYFDGYIPAENMRFRTEEYSIDLNEIEMEVKLQKGRIDYLGTIITYPQFNLTIEDGSFPQDSSITVILGENGTGKTTFINYLASYLKSDISYKPQYLNIDQFNPQYPNIDQFNKDNRYPTVEEFLLDKIRDKYLSETFKTEVLKPMQIDSIKRRRINELSGGELQRFWIVYCLGTEAHIYLIDEPSACLDVEQRVIVTKILKRFMIHNHKIGFVVEHDIMMAVSMAQEINSQIIVMTKIDENQSKENQINDIRSFRACEPMSFREGINLFLKSLDITFRTDSKHSKHNRPRINKHDSAKDKEQKVLGQYYQ